MAGEDKRSAFIREWFQRASNSRDPFDQFFFLWNALVVAAKQHKARSGGSFRERDADRERISLYFREKREKVIPALRAKHNPLLELALQSSEGEEALILDARSQRLREQLIQHAGSASEDLDLPEIEIVQTVAGLLTRIRDQIFERGQIYDPDPDLELLKAVNPVFIDLFRACEALGPES